MIKDQWNCRVNSDYRRAVRIVSAVTDIPQDMVAELGLAVLFGVDSAGIRRSREAVMAAMKKVDKLPTEQFNSLVR